MHGRLAHEIHGEWGCGGEAVEVKRCHAPLALLGKGFRPAGLSDGLAFGFGTQGVSGLGAFKGKGTIPKVLR
ncbi:hypothetical protein Ancab_013999 [Ancistrocladus abbreviatus]